MVVTGTSLSSPTPPPTSSSSSSSSSRQQQELSEYKDGRPLLVRQALEQNKPLYYFGLGSNMLRSKVENRGVGGNETEKKKIDLLSMEPAYIDNYRLAFNLKGFPPLEPGMGTLEPVHDDNNNNNNSCDGTMPPAKPLLQYGPQQCHGALIKVDPANYERIMQSEGVTEETVQKAIKAKGQSRGYEEVVVKAVPYRMERRHQRQPSFVYAVALRARPRSRLPYDVCPSERYMSILREGAKELGLRRDYQDYLERHPVQQISSLLLTVAKYNAFFVATLSYQYKQRWVSEIQRQMLFALCRYTGGSSSSHNGVSGNDHNHEPSVVGGGAVRAVLTPIRQWLGNLLSVLVLLPGATAGLLFGLIIEATGWKVPMYEQIKASVMFQNKKKNQDEKDVDVAGGGTDDKEKRPKKK